MGRRLLVHLNGVSAHLRSPFDGAHVEEIEIVRSFARSGWQCYLADWRDVDPASLVCSVLVNAQTLAPTHAASLNEVVDLIIARSLGSVEAQYDRLVHYFGCLEASFSGAVINDPRAVVYGMDKRYLLDLAAKGQPVVDSCFFPPTVRHCEIPELIPWKVNDAIIKPVSGECGNSVARLCDIDESFLRRKEQKVKGWMVQPYLAGIIDGEISLLVVNGEFIFAVRKTPALGEFRVNERWRPQCELVEPSEAELAVARSALGCWPYPAYLARVDLVTELNTLLIVEVETVNPGFLYGAPPYEGSQLRALEQLERLGCSLVDAFARRHRGHHRNVRPRPL